MFIIPLVREKIAKLVNAEVDEVVLVPNTTHGINTVLYNLEWQEEDYLVVCTSENLKLCCFFLVEDLIPISFHNLRSHLTNRSIRIGHISTSQDPHYTIYLSIFSEHHPRALPKAP